MYRRPMEELNPDLVVIMMQLLLQCPSEPCPLVMIRLTKTVREGEAYKRAIGTGDNGMETSLGYGRCWEVCCAWIGRAWLVQYVRAV